MARSTDRRAPLWARLGVAAGCLLLAPAGGLTAGLARTVPAAADRAALTGPLNLLLVGIDPRDRQTAPLADTIIVAHVPADRSRAYLFSLPRDLVVPIPAFPKSGSVAQRAKINAAMALGSRIGDRRYRPAQGFELLARTVGEVTGIARFHGGAVLDFGGFTKVVDTLGGVRLIIDQDVASEHRKPDGSPRDRLPQCRGHHNCRRPYTGVRKVYPRSDRPVRLSGWEALDYLRQRYGLPRSDYDRQRHQRQFVTAMAKKFTGPGRLLKVMAAAGDSLTFVGGGHPVTEWTAAVRKLTAADIVTIGLPGEPLFENGTYLGERLPASVGGFFAAVAGDRVAPYLLDHPGLVDARPAGWAGTRSPGPPGPGD